MEEVETKKYTDYCFTILLGDKKNEPAPIREVKVLSYAEDYCAVEVEGIEASIQTNHIYLAPERFGKTPSIVKADIIKETK